MGSAAIELKLRIDLDAPRGPLEIESHVNTRLSMASKRFWSRPLIGLDDYWNVQVKRRRPRLDS